MKKIIVLFFLNLISIPGFTEDPKAKLFQYWLVQVAEGLEDINQPVVFEFPRNKKDEVEVKKLINSREARPGPSFKSFTFLLQFGSPQDLRTKYLDTKSIPNEIFSKVLTRRKTLINSFVINYNDCWTGDKDYFLVGFNAPHGYLEGVQIATLEQLIINRDLRFEKEAQELLNYLYEGKKVPPPINGDIFPSKHSEEGYYGCYCNPPGITLDILYYLELCKQNKK